MRDLILIIKQYINIVFGQNTSFIVDSSTPLENGKYAALTVLEDVSDFECTDLTLDASSAEYPTSLSAGITLYGYFVDCSVSAGSIKFYSK